MPIGPARSAVESARSVGLNRADLEATSGGYYEGLIGVDGPRTGRNDLSPRLGKPTDWVRFHAANVTRPLPNGDFLQFELRPNVRETLFGKSFTTNEHGMRDRPYSVDKPAGIYRIAVLGSSMDMGWGIGTQETYVNLLEDWLNAHAAKRGLSRRFQVLNFAVAAYSPLQRLETFRRKSLKFQPDMVLYSATMLDNRLAEIHLCDLFRGHSGLPYDFLRDVIRDAGLTADDLRTDSQDRLVYKETVKRKLSSLLLEPLRFDPERPRGRLPFRRDHARLPGDSPRRQGRCPRSPRRVRRPLSRDRPLIRRSPCFDLSATFDDSDPSQFEIASWDDHPNALGHRRLFLGLCQSLVKEPSLYHALFPSKSTGK